MVAVYRSRSFRRWFLIALIAVNLMVLGLAAQYVVTKMTSLDPTRANLRWGDQAPELQAYGILPGEALTVLFFFDNAMRERVVEVVEELSAAYPGEEVRVVGIYRGEEHVWLEADIEKQGSPIVWDRAGHTHEAFGVFREDGQVNTIAIDRKGVVRLSVNSLVPPALVIDFADRRIGDTGRGNL